MRYLKQLFAAIAAFFLLALIAYVLVWRGRIELPDYSYVGIEDMRSMAFFFCGLSLLCVFFSRYVLICVLSLFVMTLTISNWWYYSFYRSFVTVGDLKIGASALETAKSFSALLDVVAISMYVLPVLCLLWILKRLMHLKVDNNVFVLMLSVLSIGLGVNYQARVGDAGFLMPGPSSDVTLHFVRSVWNKSAKAPQRVTQAEVGSLSAFSGRYEFVDERFPLQHPVENLKEKKRYNVILVMLESVQAARMGLYNEKFRDSGLTKNLDGIAKQHFYRKRAYANSVQTIRAELTSLCSLYDMSKGAPISTYNLPFKAKCLPEVLKDNGYETFWFHGYESSFFNRNSFHPKLGFDYLYDQEKLEAEIDDVKRVGWGVSDEQVLVAALDVLERQKKPFFAEILTVSNHYPFDHNWGISFSKEIEGLHESYVNKGDQVYADLLKGVAYTDYSIGKFWERFKQSSLVDDTLVYFITDHGVWVFPEEEKDSVFENNESYFRVPWIEYHPDGKYLASNQETVSQLNFAPTVLKSLGLSAEVSFMGESVDEQVSEKVILAKVGGYAVKDASKLCVGSENCGEGYQDCYKPIDKAELACASYISQGGFASFSDKTVALSFPEAADVLSFFDKNHMSGHFFCDDECRKQK